MDDMTVLDMAHAAMDAAPQDEAARLRFYERLADCELFLMLTEEMRDDSLSPEIFDLADGRFALVFDREDRLARFAGRAVPYAALSGRALAQMLAPQAIGLGVNLEVAPSSILIPAEALSWLADTLSHGPDTVEAQLAELVPPSGLPEALVSALDTKLATATGLAHCAYLVGTVHDTGARGHMLAFVDAVEAAQPALARAVSEALTFSGIEAGALDVGFFAASDPLAARLAAAGLRFDLPQPVSDTRPSPVAPGSDPSKPPILR